MASTSMMPRAVWPHIVVGGMLTACTVHRVSGVPPGCCITAVMGRVAGSAHMKGVVVGLHGVRRMFRALGRARGVWRDGEHEHEHEHMCAAAIGTPLQPAVVHTRVWGHVILGNGAMACRVRL